MSGDRLEGITVIEVCNAIAGPFAGRILAENGATVIKVEPTYGSEYRRRLLWYDTHDSDEFSYRFLTFNVGKQSIAVDLKDNEAENILKPLIEDADVVIENLRAGVLERLGFGWERVKEWNHELVYCSINGYGADGPYEDRPAYDPVIQSLSGWTTQIGGSESPQLMKIPGLDHATAMSAINGILMAIIERSTSGEGQKVEVAMLDVAVSCLGHYFAIRAAAEADETLNPSFDLNIISPSGIFETADEYLTLLVVPDQWEEFCHAINHSEFADPDHEFGTNDKRLERESELETVLEDVLGTRTTAEWINLFAEEASSVVCAEVNDINAVFDDPQVRHRDLVVRRNHSEMGPYLLPRLSPRFSTGEKSTTEPPGLGEQTDEVLRSIGYGTNEIESLRASGTIY